MANASVKDMLQAGVHFGHQTRRWNPKMKEYIYTERNGIYIIDLQQTVGLVDKAYNAIKDTVAEGGTVSATVGNPNGNQGMNANSPGTKTITIPDSKM